MANQELVSALREGRLDEWREANPLAILDLSDFEIAESLMPHLPSDLRRANLRGVQFQVSMFSPMDFRGADLSGARFGKWGRVGDDIWFEPETTTSFHHCKFDDALMGGVILDQSLFAHCSFDGVRGIGIRFHDSVFHECTFRLAVLSEPALFEYKSPPAELSMNGKQLLPSRWPVPNIGTYPIFRSSTFSGTNFEGAVLDNADFQECSFHDTTFKGASLARAQFDRASSFECLLAQTDLRGATFINGHFDGAIFDESNAEHASFAGCQLSPLQITLGSEVVKNGCRYSRTDERSRIPTSFVRANLRNSDLSYANLVRANLTNATLQGARVYGVSAWDPVLEGTNQLDLLVSDIDEPEVRADNLLVAQFVRTLLSNDQLRHVIEVMKSKTVLILGSFTPEGMIPIEAIKSAVRDQGLIPITFEWKRLESQSLNETVRILANLARFIILDLTLPFSTINESQMLANMTTGPVLPTAPLGQSLPAMQEEFFLDTNRVLPLQRYADADALRQFLREQGIPRLEERVQARQLQIAAIRKRQS